jgi:hypothetical protein
MDELLGLAAEIRQHYLRAFLASLAIYKASHSPSAPEVMFEHQRDAALPFKLYRADMASNVNGVPHLQDVNPSTHLGFEPFEARLHDVLACKVSPIVWNNVELDVNVQVPDAELEAWAMKWLDLDDRFVRDEDGLQGVIHSVTKSDSEGRRTEIAIDFGSAPVVALEELLLLAAKAGATQASIHSSNLA